MNEFQLALPERSYKRQVPKSIEDMLTDPYQHLTDLSTVPDNTLEDASEFISERRRIETKALNNKRRKMKR